MNAGAGRAEVARSDEPRFLGNLWAPTSRPTLMETNALTSRRAGALVGAALAFALLFGCSSTPGVAEPVTTTTSVVIDPTTTAVTTPTEIIDVEPLSDLTDITYSWNTGSIAPPWNHQWTFTLVGTSGVLDWTAGGPDAEWTRSFDLSEQQAADYREGVALAVAENPLNPDEDQRVGGKYGTLIYARSGGIGTQLEGLGTTDSSDRIFVELTDLAQQTIPADVFAEVEAEYNTWLDAQQK